MSSGRPSRYQEAGVDIDKKYEAVARARDVIRKTFTKAVLSDIGSFGGLFDPAAVGAAGEVLVASSDGVGTKLKVAIATARYDTVGQCLVNHCINDILVQGARPLFFLDYIGIGRMEPELVSQVLEGLARACCDGGLALLGGETAEMPGIYQPGDFDLVGTIVGSVPRDKIIDGSSVRLGDSILALPSNGLHTNGYSLARKILLDEAGLSLADDPGSLGESLGDALLAVHKSYLHAVLPLLCDGSAVHACAHITGGGLFDNVPRVLPDGLGVEIEKGAMPRPAIFDLICDVGDVPEDEAYRVFNMGFGFLLIVEPQEAAVCLERLRAAGEAALLVGKVVAEHGNVRLL